MMKRSSKRTFRSLQVKYRSRKTPMALAQANLVRFRGVRVASSTSLDQRPLLTRNLLS